MIDAEDVVLVLLAAGQSSRFGMENKLEAEFLGKPVGFHVTTALESIPFADRIVVTDGCQLDFASRGYRVIHNNDIAKGMSFSLHLGVQEAIPSSPKAILIALADMPRVTAAHIYRLFDAFDGPDAVVVSSNGEYPTPPGVFGSGQFDALLKLEGDEGAQEFVRLCQSSCNRRLDDCSASVVTRAACLLGARAATHVPCCGAQVIDAKHVGGVARFINHCCGPNLVVQNVLAGHSDERLTRVGFVRFRSICAHLHGLFD